MTSTLEKQKYVTVTLEKSFLLVGSARTQAGTRRNGRRIEHFIGENEYFS
jgi:hypothetical protein